MKLTPKRKVMISVACLCVLALAVDRLFLAPGPSSAQATAPPPATPVTAAISAPSGSSASPPAHGPGEVAQQFLAIAEHRDLDLERIPDAFTPSEHWFAQQRPTSVPRDAYSAAEMFKRTHRLTAVMAGERGGSAIIDGRPLLIGQQLDGFTLVAVEDRVVRLRSGEILLELSVPAP